MKVIKYGKGYEPKVATCEHCKSEIEYEKCDINVYTYYCRADGSMLVGRVDQITFKEDDVQLCIAKIECPVCGSGIVLSEEKIPTDMKFTLKY